MSWAKMYIVKWNEKLGSCDSTTKLIWWQHYLSCIVLGVLELQAPNKLRLVGVCWSISHSKNMLTELAFCSHPLHSAPNRQCHTLPAQCHFETANEELGLWKWRGWIGWNFFLWELSSGRWFSYLLNINTSTVMTRQVQIRSECETASEALRYTKTYTWILPWTYLSFCNVYGGIAKPQCDQVCKCLTRELWEVEYLK